jgi:cysteine desulfurase
MRTKGDHIVTSAFEHHAVLETCKYLEGIGFRVTYLKVDGSGMIDPEDVRRALTARTVLVSIMHANNEIGTIQPIAEIGRITTERGVCFHTDAVQSFGHIPTNVGELGVDLLSASAHKLYGPKGAGILYIRKGTRIDPIMHGGEQEKRRRASTHNVPGIVGFGKAVEIARREMDDEAKKLTALRDRLIRGIFERIESVHLNGDPVQRLPNNVNLSFERTAAEALVLSLDMGGVACSSGSACTSMNIEPSHVLAAIGVRRDLAHGSLRFSLGRPTTEEDIAYVLEILPGIVKKLRSI